MIEVYSEVEDVYITYKGISEDLVQEAVAVFSTIYEAVETNEQIQMLMLLNDFIKEQSKKEEKK